MFLMKDWQWVDGSNILYTNWLDNQPDNAWGGQNYGIMECSSGQWDDAGGPDTEEIQYYLMEIECDVCSSSDEISVTFETEGCTDEFACNYDSNAFCDDGSCEYIDQVDLGEDITTCDELVTLDAGSDMVHMNGLREKLLKLLR